MKRMAFSFDVRLFDCHLASLRLICAWLLFGIAPAQADDKPTKNAETPSSTENRRPSPWDDLGANGKKENKVEFNLFLESEGFAALEELLNYVNTEKQKLNASATNHQTTNSTPNRLRKFHFLGIGINNYLNPQINKLNAPVRDVARFAEIFGGQESIEPEIVTKRTRMLFDQSATKSEIERQLTELPNWVEDDSTVVIAYSGHGSRIGGLWYMSTYDYDPKQPEKSGVSGAFLIRAIDALIKARKSRVVLIVDACHSGSLMTTAEPLLGKYQHPRQGGLIVLLSSIASEASLDGSSGSLFAQMLWGGLKGYAHTSPTDSITVKELRRYLRASMPFQRRYEQKMSKVPGTQTPEQNFLFETSLSISEDLGIVTANPKHVFSIDTELPPESPEPSALATVVFSEAPIVGKWKSVREFDVRKMICAVIDGRTVYVPDEKTVTVTEELTLILRDDGLYVVEFQTPFGNSEKAVGYYRYTPGREFSLSYAQGTDHFTLDKLTETQLIISLPTGETYEDRLKRMALGGKNPSPRVWVFERVPAEQTPK